MSSSAGPLDSVESDRTHPESEDLDSALSDYGTCESDANQIVISDPALPGGSVTLAGLLAGGNGSCSTRNDKDTHQGESGWWFYFNFSASQVTFTGP